MFDSSCSGNGRFETGSLSDEPIGEVPTVTITADSQPSRICDAIAHKCVYTRKDVFSRSGDKIWTHFPGKLIPIPNGATIIGFKNQPVITRSKDSPVAPYEH